MERLITLLLAGLLDRWLGDPVALPHPVVGFGRLIAKGEHAWNWGKGRRWKGAVLALSLVAGTGLAVGGVLALASLISSWVALALQVVLIFYCLAGTTLVREVREVFFAVDRSLEEGRRQVARIVGRDTSELTAQEVRTAALETLAENLSDGVVAPLFWWALLGVPGMMAYKMVNTLDSMIGYRNERYAEFGCFAARMDDVANYIPARLTAVLLLVAANYLSRWRFVVRYGTCHASPNSGYPEAAMAGILDCRFGGPHSYFGEVVWKPFIGTTDRPLGLADMRVAIRITRRAEILMLVLVGLAVWLL